MLNSQRTGHHRPTQTRYTDKQPENGVPSPEGRNTRSCWAAHCNLVNHSMASLIKRGDQYPPRLSLPRETGQADPMPNAETQEAGEGAPHHTGARVYKPVVTGSVWPVPVKPVRSGSGLGRFGQTGSGLGRYQTGPNSKFEFEFKKWKIPQKNPKNTSRCDESNSVKFS